MFRGIVAMDSNRLIGKGTGMAWGKKDGDLKYFKHLTQQFGGQIILGRKTWEGMGCCHLQGRTGWVLTNQDFGWTELENEKGLIRIFRSFEELPSNVDFWLAGGLSLYRQALDKSLIKEFWVTELKKSFEGDVFMPAFEDRFNKKDLAHENENYASWRYYNE